MTGTGCHDRPDHYCTCGCGTWHDGSTTGPSSCTGCEAVQPDPVPPSITDNPKETT